MDESQFWSIIDESLKKSAGSFDAQEEALHNLLKALLIDEIDQFVKMFHKFEQDAYRWDIWAAAYLVGGGCSDDSFMDFRSWLISRGQTAYDRVIETPDNLADIDPGEDYFFESFQYIPSEVYKECSGEEWKDISGICRHREPGKPDWDFDFDNDEEMSCRLPRLWEKEQRAKNR